MSEPTPTPEQTGAASAPRRSLNFRPFLPHLLTASLAVALSFALQLAFTPPQVLPVTPVATVAPRPAITATPAPTVLPVPTLTTSGADILRQQVIDLREENRRLWSALYLMRAATQIADAEAALLINDLAETDRLLLVARASLDGAYTLSAEQDKGPIERFRFDLARARDDLFLRPEGLDRRLRELRRLVLELPSEE